VPEVDKYAPGTPCWVDVSTNDIAGATRFYGELFGWDFEDMGEEAGHYTMCKLQGHDVCAIGPNQGGGPNAWNTYFAVEQVDDAVKRITDAGGSVVAGPMDVFTAGRMAVAQDPTGGFFSVWQAGEHIGATLVNEPNTLTWNELDARDLDKALAFYKEVFGFAVQTSEQGGMQYSEVKIGDRTVAGAMTMPPMVPPEVPTNWMTYFAVDDTDAKLARIGALGGGTIAEPMDIPAGRFAVAHDPFGAVFGIIKM
jgi:predicted enzyme related to lactoylglutathione lyase